MTLRYVLLHLDKSDGSAARADVAISLAKRFGARLAALYAVSDPDVPEVASRNRYLFVERAAGKAQAAFQQHAASFGIEAEWLADIGSNDNEVNRAVVLRARDADLVVLGQYEPAAADGRVPETLVETTILQAGRPVLVVPFAGHFEAIGRRVVIAWNASREVARAVHDALPLLAQAEQVTLLVLADAASDWSSAPAEPATDGILRHLGDHGVRAEVDRLVFDSGSIEPAERLLSHLADAGADLLVMGAAGQQMGRAAAKRSLTRHVLAHMTVPTLLSY